MILIPCTILRNMQSVVLKIIYKYHHFLFFPLKGIVFKKFGKPLLQARKMAYQCMTLYGNGFDKIESMCNQKADVLYQDIKKLNGKPVDVKEIICE